jgi:hypothetical protein
MQAVRKVLLGIGSLVAAAVAGIILYETASPDGRFFAIVERRMCREPKDDWAMVMLRASDGGDQPVVFKLLEANGPIVARWADWSRLEIRYPVGAKTWQSTQPQGWPSVRYLEVSDP